MLQTAYQPPSPAKARATAILCAVLALATAAVTSWFVVEGIKATEPASTARWAKVAAGVLLLVLELGAFGVAAQWIEHSRTLRALGWFVLVLEITFMSLAQISIGTTAGKVAEASAGTVKNRDAEAADYRKSAALLEAQAKELKASRHAWKREQGAAKEAQAAAFAASAAAVSGKRASEATSEAATSTPLVEIVGRWGLIGLSVALSLALSLGGIVMMHVAGSLWRRASGEFVPVEVQILQALHELQQRVSEAAPARRVIKAGEAEAEPVPRLVRDPQVVHTMRGAAGVSTSALPAAGNVIPAPLQFPAPGSASPGRGFTLGAAGLGLAAFGAAPEQGHAATVAVYARADVSKSTHADVSISKQQHEPRQARDTGTEAHALRASSPARCVSKSTRADESESKHLHDLQQASGEVLNDSGAAPSALGGTREEAAQQTQLKRAPRVGRVLDGGRRDTGTDAEDGSRYQRVRKAIKAGKLAPSIRAIQKAEGGSPPVVRRYLEQLKAEGVIERRGRGWERCKDWN